MTTMRKLPLPRLAIIGTVGVPARYGGFETLAQQLVVELGDRYDMQVYNSGPAYEAGDRPRVWGGARLVYLPLRANGLQSIAYDGLSMLHALFTCQALLVLGVSGGIFLPLLKLFSRKRVIVNVDGLEWRRPKWGWFARNFLRWSESIVARYADEIITDNAAIQKYMLDRHGRTSRLITYGSDHIQPVKIKGDAFQDYPFLQSDYAFKVCRIEPENMLDMILEAFSQQTALPLVLVGNWDHSEYGRALRAKYASYAHLHLLDPIYEPQCLNLLRSNCAVYVHGHSAGGTNPSLVEAMYLGLPVLAYGVIYNRLTSCHEAVYFDSAEELQQLLRSMDKPALKQLGQRMRAIAQRDYSWAGIADAYAEAVHGEVAVPTPVFNFELPLALRQTF